VVDPVSPAAHVVDPVSPEDFSQRLSGGMIIVDCHPHIYAADRDA
jgi:hypothetical protein